MTDTGKVERAACIGAGVIGAGWAARLVQNGIDVRLFDPDPQASAKVAQVMANAERAYARLVGDARPAPGALELVGSLEAALEGAEFVQESVPERLELKREVLARVDAALAPEVPIASSTSGIKPSDLQPALAHPERLLVGHPYNPVYLLPLVELVAGTATGEAAMARARAVYRAIGMRPITVRREIEAFVGDRLLEALWREALWLVRDDVASVEEIDDVIRFSFGLRWAQMGLFQTYRVAGGEAGMRHFLAQFGPCLKWPWTRLTDVPELDDALVEKIAAQSDAQAAGRSVRELERIRDDNLIAIMEALEGGGGRAPWGAGALLTEYKAALAARRAGARDPAADGARPGGAPWTSD